ncbi:MAG TPA: TIGR01777 family oxidoreductase [Chitinophagaceae bacterium]|nr:TIGR01777 family oxidoreductase [Chitinophagaceae bacterium]
MKKKIVIAGGTGFIGKYLNKKFSEAGYDVLFISRDTDNINWNNEAAIIEVMEHAAMLINLAGRSVDCRYNEKNKKEILLSRTGTTKALGNAVLKCNNPPSLWINSSTATIYRHAEDRPMMEDTGEIGKGFSANVATSWEQSFFAFKLPATRQLVLRMAIVLGKDGGVIKPLTNLVRFGLGGKQGNGNQMFSWIHIEDVYGIIVFIQTHSYLQGIFNCSAPNPVANKTFMQVLRQAMHVSFGLPAPAWLLEIGAVIIRTETELILKSRWVIPGRLLKAGYEFKYPYLNEALGNIIT